jgi:hypothetical protein
MAKNSKDKKRDLVALTPMFLYGQAALDTPGHFLFNGKPTAWNPAWDSVSKHLKRGGKSD